MAGQWTPPPNWPAPQPGWQPPPGWHPDPAWGPAPPGWNFYPPDNRPWVKRHVVWSSLIGVLALMFVIGGIQSAVRSGSNGNDSKSVVAPTIPVPVTSKTPGAKHSHPTPTARPKPTHTAVKPVQHSATSHQHSESWIMPNLVGQNLQAAQDAVQALTRDGLYFTHSHDLRGDRHQIFDRDWQVCTQNVPPGATIHLKTYITFGVVREDVESCP